MCSIKIKVDYSSQNTQLTTCEYEDNFTKQMYVTVLDKRHILRL